MNETSVDKEKIVVVGYGWVGQANALALLQMGYEVYYYDTAPSPTLHYSDEYDTYALIQRAETLASVDGSNTHFIVSVGDVVSEDLVQDISRIKSACDSLRNVVGKVTLRSTVLPQNLSQLHFDFYVPEFLHEKNAVEECLTPYYFVVGVRKKEKLPSFLEEWKNRSYRSFLGTPEEASYIKYLSNIWNAVRIAFVNEIGDSIGEPKTHKDIMDIERVIDFVLERKSYMRYGRAFDGHCLPKDMRAYIGAHEVEGKHMDLLRGAYTSNEQHKSIEATYNALPKVYSFWDYTQNYNTFLKAIWQDFNDIKTVRKIRKELRFVHDAVMVLIPERSMRRSMEIWENKARENPLYYSNTRTRSGMNVLEKELIETGQVDFEDYIVRDPQLQPLVEEGKQKIAVDFGSGVGRITNILGNHFGKVYGIDVSETMLTHARKRTPLTSVEYLLYDGGKLPLSDESADFIFSLATLQHVPSHAQVEQYMRDFYRILKKDGYAKVQLRGGRGVRRWEWSYGASYDPYETIALARRVGFDVLNHQVLGTKYIWLTLQK